MEPGRITDPVHPLFIGTPPSFHLDIDLRGYRLSMPLFVRGNCEIQRLGKEFRICRRSPRVVFGRRGEMGQAPKVFAAAPRISGRSLAEPRPLGGLATSRTHSCCCPRCFPHAKNPYETGSRNFTQQKSQLTSTTEDNMNTQTGKNNAPRRGSGNRKINSIYPHAGFQTSRPLQSHRFARKPALTYMCACKSQISYLPWSALSFQAAPFNGLNDSGSK